MAMNRDIKIIYGFILSGKCSVCLEHDPLNIVVWSKTSLNKTSYVIYRMFFDPTTGKVW